jgi:hypothetical protein
MTFTRSAQGATGSSTPRVLSMSVIPESVNRARAAARVGWRLAGTSGSFERDNHNAAGTWFESPRALLSIGAADPLRASCHRLSEVSTVLDLHRSRISTMSLPLQNVRDEFAVFAALRDIVSPRTRLASRLTCLTGLSGILVWEQPEIPPHIPQERLFVRHTMLGISCAGHKLRAFLPRWSLLGRCRDGSFSNSDVYHRVD